MADAADAKDVREYCVCVERGGDESCFRSMYNRIRKRMFMFLFILFCLLFLVHFSL